MTKQKISLISAAGILAAPALSVADAARPNVIMLAVDDWNDWIGAMGYSQAVTPNMDRLAARGILFNNAHTPAVYCAPSRSALLTGLSPATTGFYQDQVHFQSDPSLIDLHWWFRQNGYYVAGAGKVYHHMRGCIDMRGFDEYFVWNPDLRKKGFALDAWGDGSPLPAGAPLSPATKVMQEEALRGNPQMKTPLQHMDFGALPNDDEEKMADTIGANWAAEFLSKEHSAPFFLSFGLYAPHKPNFVPQKYFDLYSVGNIVPPPFLDGDMDDLPPVLRERMMRRVKRENRLIDEVYDIKKETIRGYLAAISYADAMLGRILDALEKSPYANNTIVVFWSDNGYHNGEKGIWAKHTLWQRTSHIPLMFAGPGIAKGSKIDATVSLLDIYPTLTALCGLPENPVVEGVNLTPALKNPAAAEDRFVLQTEEFHYSLINRDWRYTRYDNGEEELYNLRSDPNEWFNLAGNPEFDSLKKTLRNHFPENPKPPALRAEKELSLKISGESFEWVPKSAPPVPEVSSVGMEIRTDWCVIHFDPFLKAGVPFTMNVRYIGIPAGRIGGIALHGQKKDGKYGGMLKPLEQVRSIENEKEYSRTVTLGSLPEDISHATLVLIVSPTGKWDDREYHINSGIIPVKN